MYFMLLFVKLPIVIQNNCNKTFFTFPINLLMIFFIKCQKQRRNYHHIFPECKVTFNLLSLQKYNKQSSKP